MDIKKKLDLYIKENLVKEEKPRFRFMGLSKAKASSANFEACVGNAVLEEAAYDVESFINKELNENKFQKLLFNFIDSKGLKDSDVYNKASIDRRLFSKIRSDSNYHPSKETVISLASSLNLTINELEELLDSASYSLPKNNLFDIIIRFCFIEKIYNIVDINNLLDDHGCSLL